MTINETAKKLTRLGPGFVAKRKDINGSCFAKEHNQVSKKLLEFWGG